MKNKKEVGIKKKSSGYILLRIGEQWIPQHRIIVEEKIGRPLNNLETVHHLDHNRSNNSIENLMLFPNQQAHAKFHTKIKSFGITNPIRRQISERWDCYNLRVKPKT